VPVVVGELVGGRLVGYDLANLKLDVLEDTAQGVVDLGEVGDDEGEGGVGIVGVFVHLQVGIPVHYMFTSIDLFITNPYHYPLIYHLLVKHSTLE